MGSNRYWRVFTAAGFCCLLTGVDAGISRAVGSPTPAAFQLERSRVPPNQNEKQFMRKAAQGNMAEVRLGRLALRKARHQDVRRFAQHMIDEHTAALAEQRRIAGRYRITLPQDIDQKHKAVQARLSRLSGTAFDRAYMREMVKDHQETVRQFQFKANTGRGSEVRLWVASKLPSLRHHLQMARDTRSRLIATASTSGRR